MPWKLQLSWGQQTLGANRAPVIDELCMAGTDRNFSFRLIPQVHPKLGSSWALPRSCWRAKQRQPSLSKFGAMCQNCKCSTWRYSLVIALQPSFLFGRLCDGGENFKLGFYCRFRKPVCLALLEITKITESTGLKSSLIPVWFFHLCPKELLNSLSLDIYFFLNQLFCPACSLFIFWGIFTANLPVLEDFLSRSLIFLSQLWLLQWEMQECFSGTELLSWLLEVFTQS